MYLRRVVLGAIAVIAILLGLYLLSQLVQVVILLVAVLIFGSAIQPPVDWLRRRGLPAALSVLLIYLGLGIVLALIFYFLVPPLLSEGRKLVAALPDYLDDVQARLGEYRSVSGDNPFLPGIEDLSATLRGLVTSLTGNVVDIGVGVFGCSSAPCSCWS